MTMSHQRKCTRAYWEFRELFADIEKALSEYSVEWAELVKEYCVPKCELYGYCTESDSCGMYPKKEEKIWP
jgi:thymidylate synthase (FAD)